MSERWLGAHDGESRLGNDSIARVRAKWVSFQAKRLTHLAMGRPLARAHSLI
jgi:hypothetical protein